MTPRHALSSILLILAVAEPCPADDDDTQGPKPPKVIEVSSFVGSEYPRIFSDSKIDGWDQLEGSLAVEDKAAKVTYAPFLLLPKYRPLLSELRLQVGQKDNITTIGLGTRYNATAPRSRRGAREFDVAWKNYEAREEKAGRTTLYPLEEQDVAEKRRKTANATLKALRAKEAAIESSTNASPETMKSLSDEADRLRTRYQRESDEAGAAEATFAASLKQYQEGLGAFYLDYRLRLLNYRWPIPAVSYTTTLFQFIGGGFVDADNDGLNDKEHVTRSRQIVGSFDWLLAPDWQFSGLVSHSWERKSAEAGSEFGKYMGFAATLGHVIAELDKERYQTSDDFKKSLFKPQVVLGVSFEQSRCRENDDTLCKDKLTTVRAWTPFIDFKIKKESQFRIGLPLTTRIPFVGKNSTELGIVSLVAIQLGLPK